ncbi:hypothetical protein K8942_05215 [Candidatus Peribacteria bacterium]|nr:MAG: hypothetical protein K8942_05215 [Candidatus Peribacteria bacterium]
MRFLMLIGIGLIIAGGIYYVVIKQQEGVQQNVETAQQEAMKQADAYKENQAKMMRELGQ